ncbi:unnamed protein product [Jaminaea pallidilutea]
MAPKRPAPNVFGDEDACGSGRGGSATSSGASAAHAAQQQQQKRPRMTPSMLEGSSSAQQQPATAPSSSAGGQTGSVQAQIAAAKAKIAAQMAALQKPGSAGTQARASPLPPSAPKVGSSALPPSAGPSASSSAVPKASSPPAGSSANIDVARARAELEERKRRVQEMAAAMKKGGGTAAATASSSAERTTSPAMSPPAESSRPTGIHPLLMQSGGTAAPTATSAKAAPGKGRGTPQAANRGRMTQAQAQAPAPEKVNPYLAAGEDEQAAGPSTARMRSMHRPLTFNRAGRHIEAAEAARKEAELEALKQRIAERSRLAGLGGEELTSEERKIRRLPPPDVEWWDAELLPQGKYDCVPSIYPLTMAVLSEAESNGGENIDAAQRPYPVVLSAGTPIDHYVQHPIPIPAPTEKLLVEPKGVMLTKKEMKKMRRQRRAAEQEDKQDRIKMGLQAPDAPKVKLSNLMRVLTSEAVADPTKVEARVRREVAARKEQHERTNAERAVTDDQRREKLAAKMDKDEATRGVTVTAYKIRHLASGAHKFKVRKNAQQNGLGGLCVFGPDFALVVVEGGFKGTKAYKRLMTVRIDWTDPGRARGASEDAEGGFLDDGEGPSNNRRPFLGAMGDAPPPSAQSEQETLDSINWLENTCDVVFEGPQRERVVNGGTFRARTAASDHEARDILGVKWAGLWDLAKREGEAGREEVLPGDDD